MKKTTTYLALVLAAAMLSSCNDWLTEDTPGTNKRGDYFVSTETATEVVNAAYMPLMWEYGNKSTYYCEWFIGDIVSDDALKGGGSLSDMADAYDMENFRAEVDVVPSSVFYSWVFGFGGDVVINGPAEVKEEYKEMVQKVAEKI